MTHAQDAHVVVSNAVSNDVRVDNRQLAQGRAWHRPAPIGKRHEAVARSQQFFGELCRGAGFNCAM
jgi:hypothetical protein